MMKKTLGIAALLGAMALGIGVGCTVAPLPNTDASAPETGPTSTGSVIRDSGPDVKQQATCYDEEAALALQGVAPTRGSGKCGAGKIAEFKAACLGAGSNCQAFIDANKDCSRCIIGGLQGDDPKTTPIGALIPVSEDSVSPNTAACAAIVIGKPECALKLAGQVTCVASACSTCEDEASDTECSNKAATGICKSTVDEACNKAVNDAASQWQATCRGANFDEGYAKVAEFFCGGGGGADAGRD
jgi:hypothetical protein